MPSIFDSTSTQLQPNTSTEHINNRTNKENTQNEE